MHSLSIELKRVCELRSLQDGICLEGVSIGENSEVLLNYCNPHKSTSLIQIYSAGTWTDIPLDRQWDIVAYSNERLYLYSSEPGADFVHVYDVNGTEINAFYVGFGVDDIQVQDNAVFISYSDEGVFERNSLCSAGFCIVDILGNKCYQPDVDTVFEGIVDCYLQNLCKPNEAWVYFFSYTNAEHYYLVQLKKFEINAVWELPMGPDLISMAIFENLLLTDSQDLTTHAHEFSLFELSQDGQFEKVAQIDFQTDPQSERYQCITSRGKSMYLYTDNAVYLADVEQIKARLQAEKKRYSG